MVGWKHELASRLDSRKPALSWLVEGLWLDMQLLLSVAIVVVLVVAVLEGAELGA